MEDYTKERSLFFDRENNNLVKKIVKDLANLNSSSSSSSSSTMVTQEKLTGVLTIIRNNFKGHSLNISSNLHSRLNFITTQLTGQLQEQAQRAVKESELKKFYLLRNYGDWINFEKEKSSRMESGSSPTGVEKPSVRYR